MALVKNKWGWVVTVCTFIVIIPLTGIPSSFGVIFVKLQEEYEISDLETGWIGSLAFGMFFFASPISTGLFKRYGHRKVAVVGVILCSVGMLVSSFVPKPSLLFLTYSVFYGIGSNFIDNTSLNLIGQYFPRKNSARATCFATLGWSVGSLTFNPLIEVLCELLGWRNTFRILAGFLFVVGILCVATYSPAPIERPWKYLEATKEQKKALMKESQKVQEKHTFQEYARSFRKALQAPGMWLWIFGNIFVNLSLIFPFVNMIKFMTTIGIPEIRGALALTAMGITDLLGRSTAALVGDRLPFHVIYLYPLSSLVMALGIFSLLFITSFSGMIVFGSGFGFFMGIVNAMLFKASMDLFGMEILAEAWTLSLVAAGIGIMVGPTIAGATYDQTQSFTIAFYIGGSLCLLAALLFLLIPLIQKRKNWNPKAMSVRTNSTEVSVLTDDSAEVLLVEAFITTI
ncbi:monocarboxylate transporter 2-like isoform X1 [Ptychodera flava]|uniref:monocarboxylate transporter 2-like isoform X1 n=1 Tax=Ptychodera flava TaxID=63121 RepID=UPI00396A5F37